MSTLLALFNMAAKRRSAAALDVTHDAALPEPERSRVFFPVGRADPANNVRHLTTGRTAAALSPALDYSADWRPVFDRT